MQFKISTGDCEGNKDLCKKIKGKYSRTDHQLSSCILVFSLLICILQKQRNL